MTHASVGRIRRRRRRRRRRILLGNQAN